VYSPLARSITRPGMRVGIIGIGGLGHMGVKFASKMQGGKVEVTAISQSNRKKKEALAMGAHRFLDMSDKTAVAAHSRYFDYILCTADGESKLGEWLSLSNFDSTFCMVGAPTKPMEISILSLIFSRVNFVSSAVGSIKELHEMFDFAAKNDVKPIIEKLPMASANEGLKKVRDGSVRFRVVLENPLK
jgi:D-arabinose 1-dehydrogenase-like Zn-dependent alcohol dehydrogenase